MKPQRCRRVEQEWLRQKREVLRRVGIVTRGACPEVFGCGAQGCAVPSHGRRGGVVKIGDWSLEKEASFALWLKSLGTSRPAMLPNFYGVYEMSLDKRGIIAIHREDLDDAPYESIRGLYDLAMLAASLVGNPRHAHTWQLFSEGVLDIVEGVSRHREDPMLMLKHNIDQMRRFIAWLADHNVMIDDAGSRNWGWRAYGPLWRPFNGEGLLVVRDLGFATTRELHANPLARAATHLDGVHGAPIRLRAMRKS